MEARSSTQLSALVTHYPTALFELRVQGVGYNYSACIFSCTNLVASMPRAQSLRLTKMALYYVGVSQFSCRNWDLHSPFVIPTAPRAAPFRGTLTLGLLRPEHKKALGEQARKQKQAVTQQVIKQAEAWESPRASLETLPPKALRTCPCILNPKPRKVVTPTACTPFETLHPGRYGFSVDGVLALCAAQGVNQKDFGAG